MKFSQDGDISTIQMAGSLTKQVEGELSGIFDYIAGRDPHKIILDFHLMPYANSAGLNVLFQQYLPLYNKKFILEIQQAREEVAEVLMLANFHLIADIIPSVNNDTLNKK